MPDRKVAAIRAFVADLMAYREDVKADAKKMLSKVTLATLSNVDDLEEFLTEMVLSLADKHLMHNGRVRPQATRMIRRYVDGMMRR